MTDKVIYAIVRVETDQDVETIQTDVKRSLQKLEREIGALTRIDAYQFCDVTPDDDDMIGGPTLYWP